MRATQSHRLPLLTSRVRSLFTVSVPHRGEIPAIRCRRHQKQTRTVPRPRHQWVLRPPGQVGSPDLCGRPDRLGGVSSRSCLSVRTGRRGRSPDSSSPVQTERVRRLKPRDVWSVSPDGTVSVEGVGDSDSVMDDFSPVEKFSGHRRTQGRRRHFHFSRLTTNRVKRLREGPGRQGQ